MANKKNTPTQKINSEKALFGAGCFWGIELTFSQIPGVTKTRVGYAGGKELGHPPTYEEVCSDETGYAEVVEVTFNPQHVTYDKLLDAFWHMHDPTQVNRQGPDIGSQYRSAIFYYNDAQKRAAEKSKEARQKETSGMRKIMTEITSAPPFFAAEDYHQKYLEKRGQKTCHI